jgi:hypothetical protein
LAGDRIASPDRRRSFGGAAHAGRDDRLVVLATVRLVTGRLRSRDDLRARVLAELRADGLLPQSYGGSPDRLDASGLLIVMFGMLDCRESRARALVEAHLGVLSVASHLRRYVPFDDGFAPGEATFVPCSWWAVTALAAVGQLDAARRRADALCTDLQRLLSEQFDPTTKESLGNAGLVWAHAEMARALRVLDVAELRRRWGRPGIALERLSRRPRRLARRVWRRWRSAPADDAAAEAYGGAGGSRGVTDVSQPSR